MTDSQSKPLPLLTRILKSRFAWRGSQPVTCDQFLGDVLQLADTLPKGGFVCNLCEDQYWFSVAFSAVAVSGGCNLLPVNHRKRTLKRVMDDHPGCYLLIDKEGGMLASQAVHYVPAICEKSVPTSQIPRIPGAQHVAKVFTSGSTGQSTELTKSWHNLVTGAEVNNAILLKQGLETDYCVVTVPPWHMYGLEWSVLMPLVRDSCVYTGNSFFPADVCNALEAAPAPRRLVTTPMHLNAMLKSELQFPNVEIIMCATAPLSEALAKRAEHRFSGRVLEIYGCSEAGSVAQRMPTSDSGWRFLEIFSAEHSANGVELSAPHLLAPVVLADDLEFSPAGTFQIHGRKSDLIKVGGKRESLQRLDALLQEMDGVEDAAFIMRPVGAGANVDRLSAFVVGPDVSPDSIRRQLADQIDPVFMPRSLHLVESLPRESTGKLPRASLLQLLRSLEQDAGDG